MEGPAALLPTKLFVPLLEPDVIARARLLQTLSEARGARLILVSAPAGSGKTTLIADWVCRSALSAGWLSLDSADDDAPTFISYLIEAFEAIATGVGAHARSLMRATPPPAPLNVARVLLADAIAAGAEGVIVIDDYQTISDGVIHEILTLLVERAPASSTLVVITRSDPPLPLARMRVRRQLCEVREADLRFRPEEAEALIRGYSGRELLPASVEALTGRTEGWAAGLQLAGLALRGTNDPERFVASFQGTHTFIADYLTDEVLATIAEEDRRFIVRTSLLDRFCGPLCDAALDTIGSEHRLEALFRSNLFLIPLDPERRWFRFHHLFADLLRRRSDGFHHEARNALLERASAWCERFGAVDDAVSYAGRSGDQQRVARLVAQYGVQALAAGETLKALHWVHRIPNEIRTASPDHCVIRAMVHSLTEQLEPIAVLAKSALALIDRDVRPYPYVEDAALHARWLEVAAGVLAGGREEPALAALEAIWCQAPPGNHPLRASVQLVMSNLHRLAGRYDVAEEANRCAFEIALDAESDLLRLAAVTGLAENQLLRGDLQRAIATAEQELERSHTLHEVIGTQVANVCSILALALVETGRSDAAGRVLDRAREAMGFGDESFDLWPAAAALGAVVHGPFHSSAPAVFYGLSAHVGRLLQQGRLDVVERCLEALPAPGVYPQDSTERVLLEALRVRLLAAQNDRSDLQRFAAPRSDLQRFAAPRSDGSTGYRFWDDVKCLTAARAALHGGDPVTACAWLEPLLADLRMRASPLGMAEAAVLHAAACASLGRRAEAARATREALESTAVQHQVRPWLDAGSEAIPLLERAIDLGVASGGALAHAASLLAALRTGDRAFAAEGIGALTDRELAVLRLLAAGHTNQQIGEALFLAVGTVKKHTHNIFAKLEVTNRTQAARAARERGLILEIPPASAE